MDEHAADRPDALDVAIEQWGRERPDLDVSAMGVFGRLVQVSRIWVATVEKIFAGHGLNGGEFAVLAALRRSGSPYTLIPSELARMTTLSRAGITNQLDRLEAAGLVTRTLDSTDRRSFLIALTTKGRQVVDAAATDHTAALAPLHAALSDDEREFLDHALRALLLQLRTTEAPVDK